MNNSALCIDVSKSSSTACGFISCNMPFSKPFSFLHTPKGFNEAVAFINQLQSVSGNKPDIVLEATGNYSKPITQQFIDLGYNVIVLNPLQTNSQKRKSIRKVKTDPIDTHRIAQVYYTNVLIPHKELDTYTSELRNLCRQWDGFNVLYTETQLRFRSLLILLFPKFDTVFSDICCNTAIELLSLFPSPEAVLSADNVELFNILKLSKHSDSWCNEKLAKLFVAARESLPYISAQQSNIRILQSYIKSLLIHKEILTDIRAQINDLAKLSQQFSLLTSIPGVGEITAATILGEIGDVNNFEFSKQLAAFAGLDPSVYQSGNFKATNNKISKRGSSYLRKALYQAASAAVRNRSNGSCPCNSILYEYYINKLNAGKPKKVALIATSHKLLKIIFGILKSQTPFRYQ